MYSVIVKVITLGKLQGVLFGSELGVISTATGASNSLALVSIITGEQMFPGTTGPFHNCLVV